VLPALASGRNPLYEQVILGAILLIAAGTDAWPACAPASRAPATRSFDRV
jgi:hypothetical protein